MIHPRTQIAVDEVKETYGADRVDVAEMTDGSIWLTITGLDLGPGWSPRATELSVKLVPTFPDTHPYPWYLAADLVRTDDHHVDRLASPAVVDGVNRRQLSLDAPWTPTESLAARLIGVERWLRCQGCAKTAAA